MFDKLIQIILDYLEKIVPFAIVKQYNTGILLRFGRFKRLLKPGFHWKWPFADDVEHQITLLTTMPLRSQSLTTKDYKNIVVSGVIKYKVADPEKLYTEVYDAVDALSDMTMGIIKNAISDRNWDQCNSDELDSFITKKTRVEARKWGMEVFSVTLTDIGLIRSFRLIQDKQTDNLPFQE